MNSILRFVVLPWKQLSGMGNWSYGVVREWDDRGEITAGSAPAQIFDDVEEAKAYARKEAAAWPYRTEVCYLTETGLQVQLTGNAP